CEAAAWSMISRTRCCACSSSLVKMPKLERSSGMSYVSYHLPFAWAKKSSPAFTSALPAARSRPKSPICGFGAGGGGATGAGAGAGAGAFAGAVAVQAGMQSASAARKEDFMGAADPEEAEGAHDPGAADKGYFATACVRIVPSSQSAPRAVPAVDPAR